MWAMHLAPPVGAPRCSSSRTLMRNGSWTSQPPATGRGWRDTGVYSTTASVVTVAPATLRRACLDHLIIPDEQHVAAAESRRR
jgi:hypothetical protein